MLLEEGMSESISTGVRQSLSRYVTWFSEVCRLMGRGKEAGQHARKALDVARQLKECGNEAFALHQLGVVQVHADPPDALQAQAYYQQALALAKGLGHAPPPGALPPGARHAVWHGGPAEASARCAVYGYRDVSGHGHTFWLPEVEAALG